MTERSPARPSEGEHDNRVRAALDGWQSRLLDLTKRNRALNFKPTKVTTVAVFDEQPAEVFRRLYLEERPMRFKAAPERGEAIGETASHVENQESGPFDLSDDPPPLSMDFAPYDPASPDERHTDEYLQTNVSPEALDHSLRRIDEQARSTLEEQGVNTLFLALGTLHYKESPDSDQMLIAPLVLLPVRLDRKSARSGYALTVADDDAIVNPTLREYLKRAFGVSLPDLPPPDTITDDYNLQTLLTSIHELVTPHKSWSVGADIYLAMFSFQKFVMYKDMQVSGDAFAAHRLIRQLVNRSGDQVIGLPQDVREMDLDEQFPPESTFQVVDADSSQSRALAAASRGYDLVVEGPPGTGKSQTITNLIAQALAAGKSVLFVAEKMAALEVVHDRLVRAGLGEFCLELHSTKTNKRRVMQELATALDASLQRVTSSATSNQRLPLLRKTLDGYVQALHEPHGKLGFSPFRAYGELAAVLKAPRAEWTGAVDMTTQELAQVLRDLSDLAVQAKSVGDPASHPWRDASKTFYSPADLEAISDRTSATLRSLAEFALRAQDLAKAMGFDELRALADVKVAAAIADVVGRSIGAPIAVLTSSVWDSPPPEAANLISRVASLSKLKGEVSSRFQESALAQRHEPDITFVELKRGGTFGVLAVLNGHYRAICRRWKAYRSANYNPTVLGQAADMRLVDELLQQRDSLTALDGEARSLFGDHWKGEQSDCPFLERYVAWVVEFRSIWLKHALSNQTVRLASEGRPDTSKVELALLAASGATRELETLEQEVGWRPGYLTSCAIEQVAKRLRIVADHMEAGPSWAAFEAARQTVSGGPAVELLQPGLAGQLAFADMPSAFKRAFLMKWLSTVVGERPALARFATMTHEERVAEFRDLDARVLKDNQATLVGQLRDRAQHRLQQADAVAALPALRREMARQRNLKPLRRTLQETDAALRAIKPCFLMSPLTVAQLLKADSAPFDLIIFDEASQLPPEDAIGAVIRGKQLVVVGDPKQLPPTSFFLSSLSPEEAYDADGMPLYDDAESILEAFMGAGTPMARLKWHYRSTHESLITFSNVSFYESDLYTFPSIDTGTDTNGLSFEYVDGGTYEGKGLNIVEARRVADAVEVFARLQLKCREDGLPLLSLGVGTFNLRQQLAIQDELEVRRRNDPTLDPFFDRGVTEPFFVKNLENIQGDERDVIFISVTYAKGLDGKLRYNFGPLNGKNGWRRLNVLVTRARARMRVFSSMKGDEISPAATASDGPRLLREFLIYAERGHLESTLARSLADAESPLEEDVITELTRRGVRLTPQVGAAGYRIDIGVLSNDLPGRYVCGIECDGVAYHSSETARDRDRLRRQVLEGRGWNLLRVWSTDWFKDRPGQIQRMMGFIEDSRERARREAEAISDAKNRSRKNEGAFDATQLDVSAEAPATDTRTGHQRPTAAPYNFASIDRRFGGGDILTAPDQFLATAIRDVVDAESPIHVADLVSRVASMWGNRAGSRIQDRILRVASALVHRGQIQPRGDFYWDSKKTCVIRSRAGTRIPVERIAPEELEKAVEAVLASGSSFPRPQLTNEVRSLFGFARTGALIDEAVNRAVDRLVAAGLLGEASAGLSLRRAN